MCNTKQWADTDDQMSADAGTPQVSPTQLKTAVTDMCTQPGIEDIKILYDSITQIISSYLYKIRRRRAEKFSTTNS